MTQLDSYTLPNRDVVASELSTRPAHKSLLRLSLRHQRNCPYVCPVGALPSIAEHYDIPFSTFVVQFFTELGARLDRPVAPPQYTPTTDVPGSDLLYGPQSVMFKG